MAAMPMRHAEQLPRLQMTQKHRENEHFDFVVRAEPRRIVAMHLRHPGWPSAGTRVFMSSVAQG